MSIHGLNETEFHDLASQILQTGHGVRFHAGGRSMQPFIRDGDIVQVVPLAKSRVKWGEVVLVTIGEGRLLAHRIVRTGLRDGRPIFLIKGDACSSPDGWFGTDDILGRVAAVEHSSQKIKLTSSAQLWRARIWILIAPWVPKVAWLPAKLRHYVRHLLLGV